MLSQSMCTTVCALDVKTSTTSKEAGAKLCISEDIRKDEDEER